MDRRSFLGSILAACAAPAIVRADSLMRVIPRETTIVGVTDEDIERVLFSGYSFSEIVAYTFRKHQKEIHDAVISRNNLLLKLVEKDRRMGINKAWGKIE